MVIHARSMVVSVPDRLILKGIYKWSSPFPANPGTELANTIEAGDDSVTGLPPS